MADFLPTTARRASSRRKFRRCEPRPTPARPLRLNTGRIRDQWHTMTRTGISPRLGQHLPEPFVEIHPDDAIKFGVVDDGFARVVTDYGAMHPESRGQRAAAARHAVRADPLERGERVGRARRRAGGAVHRSVFRPAREQGDAGVDRALRICVSRLCAVAGAAGSCRSMLWWARVAVERRLRLSVRRQRRSRAAGNPGCGRSPATISPNTRISAAASIARRRLPETASKPACSSVPRAMPATGTWSRACSRPTRSSDDQRRMLLSGKSTDGLASAGPIVCACFGVGRTTICDAIAAGARSAAEIGAQLKAGTNCGSCIPELKRLIAQTDVADVPHRSQLAPRRTEPIFALELDRRRRRSSMVRLLRHHR